ncbi:hypothetical protein NTHI1209_00013 [Haemophilus influenzae]|uniref:Uncharacterized protein n=1 Tax=Haemophilus influenzae TaxID=727 RepID=A0A158T0F5_HAEIF|nr:hypothetical protein NTHI1209_00013 [Haemophilus influenzae]
MFKSAVINSQVFDRTFCLSADNKNFTLHLEFFVNFPHKGNT